MVNNILIQIDKFHDNMQYSLIQFLIVGASMYSNDKKEDQISTLGEFAGTTLILFGAVYSASRIGRLSARSEHLYHLTDTESEIARLDAVAKSGKKVEIVEYKSIHKQAGHTVSTVEYHNVPIAQLKSEQIQHLNKLKANGPDSDVVGVFYGGVTAVALGSLYVMYFDNFLRKNIYSPLGKGLEHIENSAIEIFKTGGCRMMQRFKKPTGNNSPKHRVD